MINMQGLREIASELRKELVQKHAKAKMPHLGSDLSSLDILISLYFDAMGKNDRFLLSKGHAALSLYAVLHKKGIIDDALYDTLGKNGSKLGEHPPVGVPGIEIATGSLGHGLSIAAGIALANTNDRKEGHVYTLLSDGECEEGSTFEAMAFAGRMGFKNITAIADSNNWQAFDRTLFSRESLATMFRSWGWDTMEINGHDYNDIIPAIKQRGKKPILIIARTVLGKGIKQLEDKLEAHYKYPTSEQVSEYLQGME